MSPFSILFENSEILLVNKPNGVPVQGGQGIFHPLDEELSKQLGFKIHLVHRLDKETSGILMVAKTPQAASKWTKLIGAKEVSKEYSAICLGYPVVNGKAKPSGTIKSTVTAHGREQEATLHFKVEASKEISVPESEKKVTLSFVRIRLGTGRMHQIRIQMAQAGSPLAADDQHGDFRQNKLLRKLGVKKLCLAATSLTIPLNGKNETFTAALPPHMEKALSLITCSETQNQDFS